VLTQISHSTVNSLVEVGDIWVMLGPGIIPLEARAGAGQNFEILGRKPRFCSAKKTGLVRIFSTKTHLIGL
jgi:hypothetical protein